MDGRTQVNGWEVCWTESSISLEFAMNGAQSLADNNFANGHYEVISPSAGLDTIDCERNAKFGETDPSVIICAGGNIQGDGGVELVNLG